MNHLEGYTERKSLWRALIDNALSTEAKLTDNELAAFLMTLAGYNMVEIGNTLERERGRGTLTQTRAQQLTQRAFQKALRVGGIPNKPKFTALSRQGRPRK